MSYEILNNIYYNKNIYNINNDNNNTYIFELELKGLNNKNIIIRKIKKSNKGNIISQNNIDNPIIIKNNFDVLKSQDLILPEGNNDIYLKFYETKDKLIEVKYIIN